MRGCSGAFLMLLDEAQDVEVLDLAVGEKAVHRILLVAENLKDRGQLGEQQKFDIPPIECTSFSFPPAFCSVV